MGQKTFLEGSVSIVLSLRNVAGIDQRYDKILVVADQLLGRGEKFTSEGIRHELLQRNETNNSNHPTQNINILLTSENLEDQNVSRALYSLIRVSTLGIHESDALEMSKNETPDRVDISRPMTSDTYISMRYMGGGRMSAMSNLMVSSFW